MVERAQTLELNDLGLYRDSVSLESDSQSLRFVFVIESASTKRIASQNYSETGVCITNLTYHTILIFH